MGSLSFLGSSVREVTTHVLSRVLLSLIWEAVLFGCTDSALSIKEVTEIDDCILVFSIKQNRHFMLKGKPVRKVKRSLPPPLQKNGDSPDIRNPQITKPVSWFNQSIVVGFHRKSV